MHELSETSKRLLDGLTIGSAAIAGALTLNRVAAVLTIVATIVSIIVGGIRIYDRVKFGRTAAES